MSDIFGDGHGAAHDWKRGHTQSWKVTHYKCRNCGTEFDHAYDDIPDIFEAMAFRLVPAECPAPLPAN